MKQALLVSALLACAIPASGETLAFVGCPVFRNVHEMRGCWLARYQGEWYYLGSPGGVSAAGSLPPQLEHQALVEGVVKRDAERICGGVLLQPVKVSPLEEVDRRCNTILPADGYAIPVYNATAGIPDTSKLTPPPKPPFQDQDIAVEFYFDTAFLGIPSQLAIQRAAVYAVTAGARVTVKTFRGATRLSNGRVLTERSAIAQERASKIADSLIALGVPADRVQIDAMAEPHPGDGVTAPALRAAHIQIVGLNASQDD